MISGFRVARYTKTALFWVITQPVVVISHRHFGTTYLSQLHGSRILYSWRWDRQVDPKRRWEITTTGCVMTQKSVVLRGRLIPWNVGNKPHHNPRGHNPYLYCGTNLSREGTDCNTVNTKNLRVSEPQSIFSPPIKPQISHKGFTVSHMVNNREIRSHFDHNRKQWCTNSRLPVARATKFNVWN